MQADRVLEKYDDVLESCIPGMKYDNVLESCIPGIKYET